MYNICMGYLLYCYSREYELDVQYMYGIFMLLLLLPIHLWIVCLIRDKKSRISHLWVVRFACVYNKKKIISRCNFFSFSRFYEFLSKKNIQLFYLLSVLSTFWLFFFLSSTFKCASFVNKYYVSKSFLFDDSTVFKQSFTYPFQILHFAFVDSKDIYLTFISN